MFPSPSLRPPLFVDLAKMVISAPFPVLIPALPRFGLVPPKVGEFPNSCYGSAAAFSNFCVSPFPSWRHFAIFDFSSRFLRLTTSFILQRLILVREIVVPMSSLLPSGHPDFMFIKDP